jgi:hypothetical protein
LLTRVLLAPASVGVKRTASQLAALGPDGLLLTLPTPFAERAGQGGCAGSADQVRHVHTTHKRAQGGNNEQQSAAARAATLDAEVRHDGNFGGMI